MISKEEAVHQLTLGDFKLEKAKEIIKDAMLYPNRCKIDFADNSYRKRWCEFSPEYCYFTVNHLIGIPLCPKHFKQIQLWHYKKYGKVFPEV